MAYKKLREINVNAQTEKKGQLTYLSWTWAVDILMQADETATWDFPEPKYYGDTVMVFCNVTAFGKTMKMQLPVMDNRNQSVVNPDSRKISDATMRCLAKCIACFGIGLYVYAGSDLPQLDAEQYVSELTECTTLVELQEKYVSIVPLFKSNPQELSVITKAKDIMKLKLQKETT